MPKAYWVAAHMTIKDSEKLKIYADVAAPAIAAQNGRYIARGGKVVSLEGFNQSRVVVVEFPNLQAAVDCYNSEAYQSALVKLDKGVERDICIVEGLD